jgi:hypothetical protein
MIIQVSEYVAHMHDFPCAAVLREKLKSLDGFHYQLPGT